MDQPIAGLLTDLKARGLLKDTLVLWGGEFGRTPTVEGSDDGRDHNPEGFTMWLAGGGVKAGFRYGATDDYGYYAAEDKVHIHDLHATILHLLGPRPRAADLPARRPRLPADRRERAGGEGSDCVIVGERRGVSRTMTSTSCGLRRDARQFTSPTTLVPSSTPPTPPAISTVLSASHPVRYRALPSLPHRSGTLRPRPLSAPRQKNRCCG